MDPDEIIEYGTYALFSRNTAVADGRPYNPHRMSKDEAAIDAYMHLRNWMEYITNTYGHQLRDDDLVFLALTRISKKVLKVGDDATGCESVVLAGGKHVGANFHPTPQRYCPWPEHKG